VAIKPTSSIRLPRRSLDKAGQPREVVTFGRHDPCVGIRATPIAEAMLAIVLIDQACATAPRTPMSSARPRVFPDTPQGDGQPWQLYNRGVWPRSGRAGISQRLERCKLSTTTFTWNSPNISIRFRR
jgi:hypothetical protein